MAKALQRMRANGEDKTDWQKVDDAQENPDSGEVCLDWSKATLVIPQSKQNAIPKMDEDALRFF